MSPVREERSAVPDGMVGFEALAAECGVPVWLDGREGLVLDLRRGRSLGRPDVVVLDSRAGRVGPVPSGGTRLEPFPAWDEVWLGRRSQDDGDRNRRRLLDGTTLTVRLFSGFGVALRVERDGGAFTIVRDTMGAGTSTFNAMVEIMPGIQAVLPEQYMGLTGGQGIPSVMGHGGVRGRGGVAGVEAIRAALADPSRWAAGVDEFDPATTVGVLAMLGWASAGVSSAVEAQRWVQAGVAPHQFLEWTWSGWGPDDMLAWLSESRSAAESLAWRDVGFSPEDADFWERNARGLHPRTVAVAKAAGWSATATKNVKKVIEVENRRIDWAWVNEEPDGDEGAYPQDGDALLAAWVAAGVSAQQAVLCVRAGVSPAEAAAGLAAGTWDWSAVRALAALRP